ncbi:tumor necrosis factor receptor superfamily member 8 isoform X2 [Alligator mississippiensis]|uniref:tumor necrosis factor receptor superfamily member 8 isoform X2 n=1 Tax=Alligator mississippiensis TaxID=8496 RepID=UPI002877AD84|nr:tumor necrosis factor receptor superfamily member 8 isoform X2 [Alligator mississippiensis]
MAAPLLLVLVLPLLCQASGLLAKSCDKLNNQFYDEASKKCCYHCPTGSIKQTPCPTNLDKDCRWCEPEQYLKEAHPKPRCEACVSCMTEQDLVEKAPCTFNSSRVCECRAGFFCKMSVLNTCARCDRHTSCSPGYGVKVRGTSKTDVTCQVCPPGTFSDRLSSTETCRPHTDCAKLSKVVMTKGNATRDQACKDPSPNVLSWVPTLGTFKNSTQGTEPAGVPSQHTQPPHGKSQPSHLEHPVDSRRATHTSLLSAVTSGNVHPTAGGTAGGTDTKPAAGTFLTSSVATRKTVKEENGSFIPWVMVVLPVTLLLGAMGVFWQKKFCKRRIFTLIRKTPNVYQVPTQQPRPGSQGPDLMKTCARRISMLKAEKGPEERELITRSPNMETNNNSPSSTEKTHGPELSLAEVNQSSGNSLDCPVDARVRDHTNNRIEKIYIMKADTVIVGSISEVSGGKNCAVRGYDSDAEAQENPVETDGAMHYPEQETESFPENDVMIPVEEEGKEFHHPTTATEK